MTHTIDEFPGRHLSLEVLDELSYSKIKPSWLEVEVDLMMVKWFDYRFMHPAHATMLYMFAYKTAWRQACRSNFDKTQSEKARIVKHDNLFMNPQTQISSLWRGRQAADSLGMPYEVFCSLAFAEALRFWKRPHMPAPQNLYGADVIVRVEEKWKELQAGRLYYSTLDAYKLENQAGRWCQGSHIDWLKAQVKSRAGSKFLIERFKEEGVISDEFLCAA